MRYHDKPRSFPWRYWADLWQNNLPDLQSTKDLTPNTIFVAIDTEPWLGVDSRNINNKQAREVGLAVLFPTADAEKPSLGPPRNLKEVLRHFSITASSVRICGRERPVWREPLWNGTPESAIDIKPENVEATVVDILTKAQMNSRGPSGSSMPLTLIGFDLFAEFRVLAHQYPRILACFTSWVDVQELAIANASLHAAPSLRTTLVAYGYEACWPTTPSTHDAHNAGNDAIRTLCVLIMLLYFEPPGQTLAAAYSKHLAGLPKQKQYQQRELFGIKGAQLFHKRIPTPYQKYPFSVKVNLPVTSCSKAPKPLKIYEYFARFKPVAVGSHRRERFGGLICLASLEEMEGFIEEVHGMEDPGGRGTWTAVSTYKPEDVPVTTAAELEQFLEEKQAAEIAEKKRLRQQKRLDKIYVGAFDDAFEEIEDAFAPTGSTGY